MKYRFLRFVRWWVLPCALIAFVTVLAQQYFFEEPLLLADSDLPQAVLDDIRVREAMSGMDASALQRALDDAIDALPPDEQARVGPVVVLGVGPGNSNFYPLMAEAFRTKPSEGWQVGGLEIDPRAVTSEMLRAANIDDPQAREQALMEAISSLPEDLQAQLAGGFQVYDPAQAAAAAAEAPPISARMSVEEALPLLPGEMQDALQGYEHVLVDRNTFMRSLMSMPKEARTAAYRVMRLRFPDPEQEARWAEAEREAAVDRARGYFLDEDDIPLPKQLLARIRQQRLIRGFEHDSLTPEPKRDSLAPFDPFLTIEEYERTSGQLAPRMPAYAVPVGTEAFIGPWSMDGIARIYVDSVFGAPLMVTESSVDEVIYLAPNLTVFGRDAEVTLIKHRDGEWATYVSAFDGRREFHVEVAARLEGAQRDEFVRFARDIIENP